MNIHFFYFLLIIYIHIKYLKVYKVSIYLFNYFKHKDFYNNNNSNNNSNNVIRLFILLQLTLTIILNCPLYIIKIGHINNSFGSGLPNNISLFLKMQNI